MVRFFIGNGSKVSNKIDYNAFKIYIQKQYKLLKCGNYDKM